MRNTRAKTIVRDSDPKQQDQPINQDKAEIADEELDGVTGGGSLGGNVTIQKKHIAGVKYE